MHGDNQSGMQCAECEAILAEALDGTLQGASLAAFEGHRQGCAACQALFDDAKSGMQWLKSLDEAEPPRNLVHNILAQTIGALPAESTQPVAPATGWWNRLKGRVAPIFAPVVTPRFAMSFGMAFFSITMLLNIAGIHVTDFRHLDLSGKGISKTYYSTEARVIRYYENIRLVYEIESRVRDLRRAATPEKQEEESTPKPKQQNQTHQQQEQDRRNQNYSRGLEQPMLAACPAAGEYNPQARLNWRIS